MAVSTGPGSFTGLRVGLSVAKGLASGRGLALIGIPTLDGLAQTFAQEPCSPPSNAIWTVLEAGRKRYAATLYQIDNGRARRVLDHRVGNAEFVAEQIQELLNQTPESAPTDQPVQIGRMLVCGDLDASLRSTLVARLRDRIMFPNNAQNVRRAAYLAELAWVRWQANDLDDVETLAPFYLPTPSLPQERAA